ncbi:unnamed protein product [Phytomonas sp. EM1]|nr:unnamed protein product [Phytomonas sp. EM1]|eukprot:CCW65313.1 unnamed protein product [Phytomonas sp. isolate EM1]
MVVDSGARRLPCGHCYHEKCLTQWFEQHSTCPYCRANLLNYPLKPAEQALPREAPPARSVPESPPMMESVTSEKLDQDMEILMQKFFDKLSKDSIENINHSDEVLREHYHFYAKFQSLEQELNKLMDIYVEKDSSLGAHSTFNSEKLTEDLEASPNEKLAKDQTPAAAVSSEGMKKKGDDTTENAHTTRLNAGSTVSLWMRLAAFQKYHRRLKDAQKELNDALVSINELEAIAR